MHLVQGTSGSRGSLEFGYRVGEFDSAGYRGGNHAGAADRVDQVIVGQHSPRRQLDGALRGGDPLGVVDDEPDAVTEQGSVVDGGGAAAAHHLMQPDSLDENRTW